MRRANQGQAHRVAAKAAASLDSPCARRLREWRSGRKNARGADRTKELALCDCRFKPRVLVGGASPDGTVNFASALRIAVKPCGCGA